MGDVMDNGNKLPVRKRNRLKDYDYSSNGAYFITICTKDRKNIFWDKEQPDFVGEDIILPPENVQLSSHGKIAEEAINTIPKYYPHIELLQYVVMPNHIHMILFIPYDSGRMISSPTKSGWFLLQNNAFLSLVHIVIKYAPTEL